MYIYIYSISREMWAFSYNFLMGRVSVNRVSATFRVIDPCGNWPFAENFLTRRFGEKACILRGAMRCYYNKFIKQLH